MQRVTVTGVTGAGKTTLANALAKRMNCPVYDLDGFFWLPNWVQKDRALMRAELAGHISGPRWTVSGNYSFTRDILWSRADTLVWLDYALPVILMRLAKRTVPRVFGRHEVFPGCYESFRNQFLSRENLFAYAIKTHPRRRAELPAALAQPEYAHLKVHRFGHPSQTARWLRDQ
jgi:adenylate kinase family enzyme